MRSERNKIAYLLVAHTQTHKPNCELAFMETATHIAHELLQSGFCRENDDKELHKKVEIYKSNGFWNWNKRWRETAKNCSWNKKEETFYKFKLTNEFSILYFTVRCCELDMEFGC